MSAIEGVRLAVGVKQWRQERLDVLQTATRIDFGRYYRPELVKRIAGLLDVLTYLPLAIRRVAASAMILLLYWFVLFFWLTPWASVPAFVWALAGGVLIGVLVAIRGVVRRGLSHIAEILDILLDLVATISRDSATAASSEKPPEWKDLVEGVLIGVVVPSIETALRQRLPFLTRPVLWVLDRTLLRVARKMNAEIDATEPPPVAEGEESPTILEALEAKVLRARRIASRISGGARTAASFPLTALVVLVTSLVALPMAIVAWIL